MDPASTFGPYRLLEALGEGGMGRVWKAMDLRLERVVALKVLKLVDEQQRSTLVAEAKTACQLNHPNISVIYEVGEVEGSPYIAMEYVEGTTLRALSSTPQSEAFLRRLLTQAGAALEHAHQRRIVHRDIKPDHLMLTHQGDLKLLDFGVAKRGLPTPDESTHEGFTLTGETAQGISLGTPGYMSPEQAHGLPLSPATDQFSLGLVLYEQATGFNPFRKPTLLGTLQAIAHDPAPELSRLRPDLTPALVAILDRMLAKNPEDRFPSFEALQAAAALPEASSTSRWHWLRLPSPFRSWRVGGLAALVLVSSGVLGWAWLRRGEANSPLGQGRRVVAILPLELRGIPADKLWLGDSFQDAMATGLLRRGDLLVLDRTRVTETLAEAGAEKGVRGPKQVSAALGADLLLTGTLQATGDHLRLSLRLIRGQKGEVLDQITFEGLLADSLPLEGDLGKRVPALFGATSEDPLPGQAQARMPRTRECYIRGVEWVEKASGESSRAAVEAFQEALRGEPDYAPAHAGLAWALGSLHSQESHLGKDLAKAHLNQALAEARKAVELDPRLPMAQEILGRTLDRQGEHAEARLALQKAIDLDPANFKAIAALGDSFAYADDEASHVRARSLLQRALELHPRYWWANYRIAVLSLNDGDLKAARFHADRARQLEPLADYAHLVSGLSLLWLGDLQGAAHCLEEGLRQVPGSGFLLVTQALCDYARADRAAFHTHAEALSGRWAETHPVGLLLRGLQEGSAGRVPAMRDRFLAFAEGHHARDLAAIPTSERRVISVNAYHMARALTQGGQPAAARILLAEAERMHPGKLKTAAQDSLLSQLR